MKQILALTVMVLVTMTLAISCGNKNETTTTSAQHPIEEISYYDILPSVFTTKVAEIGYTEVVTSKIQDGGARAVELVNPNDSSRCVFIYDGDGLTKVMFTWKDETKIPQGLSNVRQYPCDNEKGYYTQGRWENSYIFDRSGL